MSDERLDLETQAAREGSVAAERRFCARNYAPLDVVIERADDVWLFDDRGRRYLDFMSAYSAVSHGHRHPRLVAAARAQMDRVCITSRAFHGDRLGPFLAELCRLSGLDRALPMNTGAEAVETAIKAARRWGYRVRGIAPGRAAILVADGNFHGRTTTIVGFSSEPAYRDGFGPFAPGFRHFRFGDIDSLSAVHDDDVCAVLVEPIQGEAGIIVPPEGWLRSLREWCDRRGVLLILDEVQAGLGRTGRDFAFQYEAIRPDGLVVGKALGGGILPVSAFLARAEVLDLFEPGSHGSTFGGNSLAAAVGHEALRVLRDEQLSARSAVLGRHLLGRLRGIAEHRGIAIRGRGLWAGVDFAGTGIAASEVVEKLASAGVLTRETHETAIRIAPPLTITKADLDWGIDRLGAVLDELSPRSGDDRAARLGGRVDIGAGAQRAGDALAARGQPRAHASGRNDTQAAQLLMSAPDCFEVRYRINPWMRPEAWSLDSARLSREANASWHQLRALYERLGAQVRTMPAHPDSPDLVFAANSAVVLDRKVLLARFRNVERQGEQSHGSRYFASLRESRIIDAIHEVPEDVCFEGAGDAIWDPARSVMWMGYGQRSSLEARDAVRRVLDVDTVSLALASPRFYHLDTCLCVLSGGEILWYPPAFTPEAQHLLRSLAGDALLEAGSEDADALAVNSVCLGRDVVLCRASPRLRGMLQARGYRVHVVDLEPFNRSGGAVYCLTLRLDQRSSQGACRARKLAA